MSQDRSADLHPGIPVAAGGDRRAAPRYAAALLGDVNARLSDGRDVTLVDFSRCGILIESDARFQIGTRATVRIAAGRVEVTAGGTVVRSRVSGMSRADLRYQTAIAVDTDLALLERAVQEPRHLPPQPRATAVNGNGNGHHGPGLPASSSPAPSPSTAESILQLLATAAGDLGDQLDPGESPTINDW